MQGVEQKVRMDLHPQRVESRLGELDLEPRGVRLLLASAEEVLPREARGEDREVIEELRQEPERGDLAREMERAAAVDVEDLIARDGEKGVGDDRNAEPGREQDKDAHPEGLALQTDASAEPEDRGRERRPEPRFDEGKDDRSGRRHPAEPEPARIEPPADRGEKGEEGPEGEDGDDVAGGEAVHLCKH